MSAGLVLALNVGCELVYVVQQRLVAQRVARHTADTVLADIIEVLFNEGLMRELEQSPQLGKHTHVKQLMEDIASVSVMRLDKYSMNKLWELMVMVFKWQLTIVEPNEIYVLTQRHLQGVVELVKGKPVESVVKSVGARLAYVSGEVSEERKIFMRNSLLLWLNDYNTKVSLLLRLGFQRYDGSFATIKNPTPDILDILNKPGCNIYQYENSSGDVPENKVSADPTEIKFLCREIVGNSSTPHERVANITHNFLRQDERSDSKSKINTKAQCEVEIQSCSANRVVEKLNDMDFSSEQSTLHEDLLSMLDEDLKIDQ